MKTLAIAISLSTLSLLAAAQVPYVCHETTYAQTFRAAYERSLAARQALGRASEDETAVRIERVRDAIFRSGLLRERDVADFVKSTIDEPDTASLLQAEKRAVKHSESALAALRAVVDKPGGSDGVDGDIQFCMNGSSNLIGLAQKRRASEEAGEIVRRRLAEFGRRRGVLFSEDVESSLLPIRWSCNSANGFAAAEEDADLLLRQARLTLNKLRSEFDARASVHAAAKGWTVARKEAIMNTAAGHPDYVALEARKRPLAAQMRSWLQAGLEGRHSRLSADACSWPYEVQLPLRLFTDLTQRQYDFITEVFMRLE